MNRIDLSQDIAREPDAVFAFLTDFSQLTRWRQLDSLRLEPEGPARVGTRLLSTVNAMGRRMEFVTEIVELDPERRVYDDRFLDGTFPIQSGWRVESHDGGSRLLWTTGFEGRGLMALLTPVLRRAIRRGQVEDLGKLKRPGRRRIAYRSPGIYSAEGVYKDQELLSQEIQPSSTREDRNDRSREDLRAHPLRAGRTGCLRDDEPSEKAQCPLARPHAGIDLLFQRDRRE